MWRTTWPRTCGSSSIRCSRRLGSGAGGSRRGQGGARRRWRCRRPSRHGDPGSDRCPGAAGIPKIVVTGVRSLMRHEPEEFVLHGVGCPERILGAASLGDVDDHVDAPDQPLGVEDDRRIQGRTPLGSSGRSATHFVATDGTALFDGDGHRAFVVRHRPGRRARRASTTRTIPRRSRAGVPRIPRLPR